MKQFVCDCCGKNATIPGAGSPAGWGKGTFSVRQSYARMVNMTADICAECIKVFEVPRDSWWKDILRLTKGSR